MPNLKYPVWFWGLLTSHNGRYLGDNEGSGSHLLRPSMSWWWGRRAEDLLSRGHNARCSLTMDNTKPHLLWPAFLPSAGVCRGCGGGAKLGAQPGSLCSWERGVGEIEERRGLLGM